MDPRIAGLVIESRIMDKALALGHDEFEVPILSAPRTLNQRWIARYAGYAGASDPDLLWAVPFAANGVEP